MRSVNVAERKDRLSKYLRFARGGEELVIRYRNLPIAKLVPISADGADDQELALVAAGKLRLPKGATKCKGAFEDPDGKCCGKRGDSSPTHRQSVAILPRVAQVLANLREAVVHSSLLLQLPRERLSR